MKITMKNKILFFLYLLNTLILSGPSLFAQNNKKNTRILYSLYDQETIMFTDTLFIEKDPKNYLYLFDNKLYIDNQEIHTFKKVLYYMDIIYMIRNGNHYLYIYPAYEDKTGPYIWYGSGAIFEIKKKNVIARFGYDNHYPFDADELFKYHKYKSKQKIRRSKPK